MKDFEDAYYKVYMNYEFSVAGTDNHYSMCYGGINDWHVKRDGVRDEKLTGVMKRAAGTDQCSDSAKNIANALRAQYESEKPKKFEVTANAFSLHNLVTGPASDSYVVQLQRFISKELLHISYDTKFKVTFEEIK